MNGPYRIQLLQLKADLSGFNGTDDKVDHGAHDTDELIRLADQLLALSRRQPAPPEAGLLITRNDLKWRIAVRDGALRVHKGGSLFDDHWTVQNGAELGDLPPFRARAAAAAAPTRHGPAKPRRSSSPLRSALEVGGLCVLALALFYVAFRFGMPRRKLSDLPPDMVILTSPQERLAVFQRAAGAYATGTTVGNNIVTISPLGEVTLAPIAKDGKPAPPRVREQARAGRRGNQVCIVTSFGIITVIDPPRTVNVGPYAWKAPTS